MTYVTRVYTSTIYSWNYPGGMINRKWEDIRRDAEMFAKHYCPVRTHVLQDSITGKVGCNQFAVWANVYARAPYARYVHDGTYGPIVPRRAPYMAWYGWGPWARGDKWRFKEVKGQHAKPFLWYGQRDALRANGIHTI
jgi:hypothetical protein